MDELLKIIFQKNKAWAKEFESKKYMNDEVILLSMVDCMFLKYSLDNLHMVVVTHDHLLKK